MNKPIIFDVVQTVKVRKYDVDTDALKKVLKEHKEQSGLSCKDISNALGIPFTQVAHYFRTDQSFAIPESNIWLELKQLLNIDTDAFDLSISTFIEKDNTFEKSNRIYDENGISPTLTLDCGNENILVSYEE